MEYQSSAKKILFLFLNLDMVLWRSTSGEFAYTRWSKWFGIDATYYAAQLNYILGSIVILLIDLFLYYSSVTQPS